MICNTCRASIPDDSSYCPSCGNRIVMEIQNKQTSLAEENIGTRFKQVSNAASSTMDGSKSVPRKKNSGLILVLILLAIVSLGLGAFLYQKIEEYNSLEIQYQTLENKYEVLQGKYDVADEKAKKYDKISSALTKNSDRGFSASEYVFVLARNKTTYFTLNTYSLFEDTIYTTSSGNSAKIEFTEDQWNLSTTIKITAISTGVTTVRFSSEKTDLFFDIVIYVIT